MPFDDVFGFPISRPSGVAAGVNAATDVARSRDQRHDASTCRGERQEPDVGEGWREIRTGEHAEHLADGDWMQDADGFWEPIYSFSVDGFGSPHRRYRRRKTPDERPLGAFLDEENNTLRAENATLRSEVERLRLRENEVVATKIAMSWLPPQSSSSYVALELMLKRQGGGE